LLKKFIRKSELVNGKHYLVFSKEWKTYIACYYNKTFFEVDKENCNLKADLTNQKVVGSILIRWGDRYRPTSQVYEVID
jgi:hypothetical protein